MNPLNEAYEHGYVSGQKAMKAHDRERIRARAKIAAEKTWKVGGYYVGPQHYIIEKFVEELLRDDSDE